jgi:hypothetical protein
MEITKIYWCPVTPPKRPGSAPGAGHVSLNVIVIHSSWTSRLGTTSITLGSVSYVVKRKIQGAVALGTVKCGRWYSTIQWHCSKPLFTIVARYCLVLFIVIVSINLSPSTSIRRIGICANSRHYSIWIFTPLERIWIHCVGTGSEGGTELQFDWF